VNRRGFFATLAGIFCARKMPPSTTPTQSQLEALEFYGGNQWPADVLARRIAMGRPCLVINKLPMFVQQVMAKQRVPASEFHNVVERVVRENRDRQVLINYEASSKIELERWNRDYQKLRFHSDAFVMEWPRLGT
jgi:hypothetical protein